MKKRKTLQDLTIKDNFLFGAVMQVEENCKGFLVIIPAPFEPPVRSLRATLPAHQSHTFR